MGTSTSDRIAVIGLSCRFPGADNATAFWGNLKNGVESIRYFSDEELLASGEAPVLISDDNYVKAGFIIDGEDLFDESFFGYSPAEAEMTDPQQRVFLETAWKALEDGGYATDRYEGDIGIFAGSRMSTYLMNMNVKLPLFGDTSGFQALIGNDKDYLTTRVSYKLNLKGPSVTVQSACSTSLVAIHMACESLLSGGCDMALAGGVAISVPQKMGYLYQEGMVLSDDGRCRAFDSSARGMAPGNGAGIVLLKRLEEAVEDGDRIYAQILGSAVNNDGARKVGYTAPGLTGQSDVIEEALSVAGIESSSISYVETHGTGTELGDPVEVEALNHVFSKNASKKKSCALGSVKTNIGHLDTAAGVASFIKTVLALKGKEIPPSLNFSSPNPNIDFDKSPFYVNTTLAPWKKNGYPRRAGVSSFGFGGTNAHLILEEAPEENLKEAGSDPFYLFIVSAKKQTALKQLVRHYIEYLKGNPAESLEHICYTAACGRSHYPCRLAVVADSRKQLLSKLEDRLQKMKTAGGEDRATPGKTVFLFTGQGSQYPGMGRELYMTQPEFRSAMDECDRILKTYMGESLLSVVFAGDRQKDRVNETAWTQTALFALEYSLARMWKSWGITPDMVMGHSVGEYVAACVAGCFNLKDGLFLISQRALQMQSLPARGEMAAVFATQNQLSPYLASYVDQVSLAAVNGPSHMVVSGEKNCVNLILEGMENENIPFRKLNVSHAFHSPQMAPMVDTFKQAISEIRFREPEIPLISNVTGRLITDERLESEYWGRHIMKPVLFSSGVETAQKEGGTLFLELGPQPVLIGMGRMVAPRDKDSWLPTLGKGHHDLKGSLEALGRFYMAGVEVDWKAVFAGDGMHKVPLPGYPLERNRFWLPEVLMKRHNAASLSPRPEETGPRERTPDKALPFYQVKWPKAASLPALPESDPGFWIILEDDSEAGKHLKKEIAASGGEVISIPLCLPGKSRVDPESLEKKIVTAVEKGADRLRSIVFLAEPVRAKDNGPKSSIGLTGTVLDLIQIFSGMDFSIGVNLDFVTTGALGDGNHLPFHSAIWGLVKTALIEHAEYHFRLFDLNSRTADQMAALWMELRSHRENENQIAIHNDTVLVPRLQHADFQLAQENVSVSPAGTYLVTGGTGALGRSVVHMLIESGARHIVVTGRDASRGEKLLQDLDAGGSSTTPVMLPCDVGDDEQLDDVLKRIKEEMPPLRGVFHLAAVLEDSTLNRLDHRRLSRVMGPKVEGAWNLHLLTKEMPLDFFILFSSLGSITGAPGQGNYSAANAFMDALAHYRNSQGLRATSINWGGWDGTGMASGKTAKAHMAAWGISPFSHEAAISALKQIMEENPVQVCAAQVAWSQFTGRLASSGSLSMYSEVAEDQTPSAPLSKQNLVEVFGRATSFQERLDCLKPYLRQLIAGALRMDVEHVDEDENLIGIGLDSLLFISMAQKINQELKINFVPKEVFANLTINGMAEYIANKTGKEPKADAGDQAITPFTLSPEPENKTRPFDLLDMQWAYWIGRNDAVELGSVGCHVYFEIDTHGLDLSLYESAWQKAIIAHDMLRSVILPDGTQQIKTEVPPYKIKNTNLWNCEERERRKALEKIRDTMSHKVHPADQWPLFEIRASRIEEEVIRLHISMDLLIADAYSIVLLMKYVMEFYKDPEMKPSPMSLSFGDYVRSEKKFRTTPVYQKSRQYWHDRISQFPPAPDLPLAKRGSELLEHRFVRREFRLPAKNWNQFEKTAAKFGMTPANTLLAVYAAVLSYWSRNQVFTLNITLFNRLPVHPEVNRIIGDFTSTLLLDIDASKDEPFKAFARRIQTNFWEGMDHRYYSGVRVLNRLNKVNQGTGRILMPIVFTSNLGYDKIDNGDTLIATPGKIVYNITQTPQVWLDNQISVVGGELVVFWDALEALFPEGMLDDLFAAYSDTIRVLSRDEALWDIKRFNVPSQKVLSARDQMNDTDRPISSRLLHHLFTDQAVEKPNSPAVVTSSRVMTYGELDRRASQVAALVSQMDFSPGSHVAVVMEKGWEQIVAVLGILNAGGVFVPIDPESPEERIHKLLADAQVRLVLTQSRVSNRTAWPKEIQTLSIDRQDSLPDVAPLNVSRNPQDPAYVIYTSGSTGFPKGVIIDHQGAVNTILDIVDRNGIGPEDKVFALSNLNFDLSVFDIFGTLAAGGQVVIPDHKNRKDPGHWFRMIKEHGVTVWNSVPMLMKMFLEYLAGEKDKINDSLRVVLLSGDWIPVSIPDQIKARFKNSRVVSLGGATEASIWSVFHEINRVSRQMKSIPYGRPLTNQRLYVLDPKLNPCPDWVPGDLYIAGKGLAHGYLNHPEKTARAFIIHPETGERLYKTGDLARYFPDGILEFLGREDFQVKIKGYRVELGEIETVMRQHPGVDQALVTIQADDQGDKFLVGYFTQNGQAPVSGQGLTGFIKGKLVKEMIPAALIAMEAFPLTPNGKIDRGSLPVYEAKGDKGSAAGTPPETPVEKEIAEAVMGVLDCSGVDINATFFNMGLTSLDIVRIHSKFKASLKNMISVTDMFEHTTIKALADHVVHRSEDPSQKPPLQNRAKIRGSAGARRKTLRRKVVVR